MGERLWWVIRRGAEWRKVRGRGEGGGSSVTPSAARTVFVRLRDLFGEQIFDAIACKKQKEDGGSVKRGEKGRQSREDANTRSVGVVE